MGNTTGPILGQPEVDFRGDRIPPPGGQEGVGEHALGDDVNWIYDMAWYGEAVRKSDGYICEEHPAKLSSDGVWEKIIYKGEGLRVWQYRLPNLEIVILFVFFLWQFFNILFRKMGLKIPKFTSMMLVSSTSPHYFVKINNYLLLKTVLTIQFILFVLKAGLVLNVLLTVSGDKSIIQELLFPKNKIDIPGCLGLFGFMIFWFLKGVKMNFKRILKAESKARVTGVAAVTFPIIVGLVIYMLKPVEKRTLLATPYGPLLLMESLTSFSGIARLLRDLDMNHSALGRVALSAALVSDMIGLFYVVMLVPISSPTFASFGLLIEIGFYLAICFAVVRPIMFKIIKRKREGRPIDDKYIYGIIIMVCLACMYWYDLDQFPALGAFLLGLAIPNGPPIGSELVERLESFNFGLILPLFLTSSMLRTDISAWKDCLTDHTKFAVASLIVLISLLKFSVSMIIPYLYKMPLRDSVVFSLIMSHKGIVEISFYVFSFGLYVSSLIFRLLHHYIYFLARKK